MGPMVDIGVVINTSVRACCDVLRGIMRYACEKPRWRLHRFSPQWSSEHLTPPLPATMDGWVGHIDNKRNYQELRMMACPTVTTSDVLDTSGVPFHEVTIDRVALAEQAAAFAIATGAKTAAIIRGGAPDKRVDPYVEAALAARGLAVERHVVPTEDLGSDGRLAGVLNGLTEGTIILSMDEGMAETIAEVCRIENIAIPERLMLLTASPDGLLCESTRPTLSYLRIPFTQVGYEAARLLDRVLTHPPRERICIRVPQGPVAQRESTALRITHDLMVDGVLRWLAQNAHRPVSVADVVAESPLKRRAVERRFTAALGYGVRVAIEKAHVRKAVELLQATDLSVTDVAARSGFSGPSRFCAVFHKAIGSTPAAYRQRVRAMPVGDSSDPGPPHL